MVRVRASRVSTFRVNPSAHITRKVDIIEVGMANTTMKVLRMVCRKSSITSPVIKMANIKSSWTAATDSRVNWESSATMIISAPAGRFSFRFSMTWRAESAISTVFESLVLMMLMLTPSSPL